MILTTVCCGCGVTYRILLEFSRNVKDEPILSTSPVVLDVFSQHGSSWKGAFAFICRNIGGYTSCDTKQERGCPLVPPGCLLGSSRDGFPSPHPIQDLRIPLILTLGFALKPLMLLKWKLFSLSVFGALHALRKEQNFPLLCLRDGFCLYRSQITSQNL